MSARSGLYARYYMQLLRGAAFSVAKGAALPFVRGEAVRTGSHAMAFPLATLAPWQSDREFLAVHRQVRSHTLIDVLRCYELWTLLGELREILGAVLEVGVWRGGSGALMASRIRGLGLEDPVYLCDTWRGVVKTGPEDIYYHDGAHDDASREIVAQLIDELSLDRVVLAQGVFPDETADVVQDGALRLVHVDVDVYQSAKGVFDWAWPRLSAGGVAVFDDYGFPACPGVTRLVDEQRMRADRIVLHNVNGHGIVIKR